MKVGEDASSVGMQGYHTDQGQDERAHPRPRLLPRGLDLVWSLASTPHWESGTRWWAAVDVGATESMAHGRHKGRHGNRLGDSVGVQDSSTGEGPRSAEGIQGVAMGRGSLDSGDVLARHMSLLCRFKGCGAIAGLVHPHAIENAHPYIGQGTHGHAVAFPASRTLALVVGPCPAFLSRRQPGELIQDVAQRFAAGKAFMRFSVIATLERHRRKVAVSSSSEAACAACGVG